jgi:hypothetical protein
VPKVTKKMQFVLIPSPIVGEDKGDDNSVFIGRWYLIIVH